MPIVRIKDCPAFSLPGLTVLGLAAPSRGSSEASAWRVRLCPGATGTKHWVDREEILVVLRGSALVQLDDERTSVAVGDTIIVPPGILFSLSNPGTEYFDAVAMAPAGVRARLDHGASLKRPWTE